MSSEPLEDGKRLFVTYLGGDPPPGRLGEDHEVVLVVASDLTEARKLSRAKWSGTSRPHVDAVMTIDVVDGYRITLAPTDDQTTSAIDVTYDPGNDDPT